jgi:hypothetical protein
MRHLADDLELCSELSCVGSDLHEALELAQMVADAAEASCTRALVERCGVFAELPQTRVTGLWVLSEQAVPEGNQCDHVRHESGAVRIRRNALAVEAGRLSHASDLAHQDLTWPETGSFSGVWPTLVRAGG